MTTGCLCGIAFGMEAAPVLFLAAFTHICSLTNGHSFPRLAFRQKLWCLSKWQCHARTLFQRHLTTLATVGHVAMHATSVTPASWVLLLLAHVPVAMASVTLKFPGIPQSWWQPKGNQWSDS